MTFNETPKIDLEPYHPALFLHILNHAERERKLKREGVKNYISLILVSQFASLTASRILCNLYQGYECQNYCCRF